MHNFSGSRLQQHERGSRRLICPNCLALTEHKVIEEIEQDTMFGFPLRARARRAVFMCEQCGEAYSVPWEEHVGGAPGAASADETETQSAEDRPQVRSFTRIYLFVFLAILLIAALVLVPAITVMLR